MPADLLGDLFPWKADGGGTQAPWNVLRFDGITQFYGWRLTAAQSMQSGHIPLWNPYAFAAQGGTPLLANSQSAPLYPPHWILFDLFPASQIWRAFGLSVAFHLLVALGGMYRFLRSLPVGRISACLGAMVWGLSGPVVTWLALPTFLAVTCWLPVLLWLLKTAHEKAGTKTGTLALAGAGGVGGLTLLAGHLQMAFYVLLAAFLYGAFLAWQFPPRHATAKNVGRTSWLRWISGACACFGIAFCLALPQLLPSLELSRQSHRAANGGPTTSAYASYVANALPPRNLVTLLVPDFFGHPNKNNGAYWNTNNYAEWAVYVGVLPLILAVFALALPWKNAAAFGLPKERGFAVVLMGLSLLLALGTPANAVFFWGVPGYNQTGNPARCLVLWAFAAAVLAAMGAEAGANPAVPTATAVSAGTARAKRRAALIALLVPVFLAAIGASLASRFAADALPRTPFSELMALALPSLQRACVWLVLGSGTLLALVRGPERYRRPAHVLCVLIAAADLLAFGVGYNPTASPASVFPVTPGIVFLKTNAPNTLIAPINRGWSLGNMPPRRAVLPPNTLTAYGLHDVAGYDSLFPGAYKMRAKEAANGQDASPPENGNMVFVKSAGAALNLQARFLVFAPDDPAQESDSLRRVYAGPDMIIYENPAGRDMVKNSAAAPSYSTAAFRLGLWAGLTGLGVLCGLCAASMPKQRSVLPPPPR